MKLRILTQSSQFLRFLITQARAHETNATEFRELLRKIGLFFGYEIANMLEYEEVNVTTPMNADHHGVRLCNNVVVVSSFEDADYFAAGIRDVFPLALVGKIDALRTYAEGRWRAPIQKAELPKEVPPESAVVIAKAILASGCTAISLIGKTLEIVKPKSMIVAAIIAHQDACHEIANEYPYVSMEFMIGEMDPVLDEKGYVIPGIGNISDRLGRSV
jgi:uracil phosphoribosyltransferase